MDKTNRDLLRFIGNMNKNNYQFIFDKAIFLYKGEQEEYKIEFGRAINNRVGNIIDINGNQIVEGIIMAIPIYNNGEDGEEPQGYVLIRKEDYTSIELIHSIKTVSDKWKNYMREVFEQTFDKLLDIESAFNKKNITIQMLTKDLKIKEIEIKDTIGNAQETAFYYLDKKGLVINGKTYILFKTKEKTEDISDYFLVCTAKMGGNTNDSK